MGVEEKVRTCWRAAGLCRTPWPPGVTTFVAGHCDDKTTTKTRQAPVGLAHQPDRAKIPPACPGARAAAVTRLPWLAYYWARIRLDATADTVTTAAAATKTCLLVIITSGTYPDLRGPNVRATRTPTDDDTTAAAGAACDHGDGGHDDSLEPTFYDTGYVLSFLTTTATIPPLPHDIQHDNHSKGDGDDTTPRSTIKNPATPTFHSTTSCPSRYPRRSGSSLTTHQPPVLHPGVCESVGRCYGSVSCESSSESTVRPHHHSLRPDDAAVVTGRRGTVDFRSKFVAAEETGRRGTVDFRSKFVAAEECKSTFVVSRQTNNTSLLHGGIPHHVVWKCHH